MEGARIRAQRGWKPRLHRRQLIKISVRSN
jgi:hypothetical protein